MKRLFVLIFAVALFYESFRLFDRISFNDDGDNANFAEIDCVFIHFVVCVLFVSW